MFAAAWTGHPEVLKVLLRASELREHEYSSDELIWAAMATADNMHLEAVACLVKELHKHYPAELLQLLAEDSSVLTPGMVAAVLDEWASEADSFAKQQAALRKREQDLANEKQAVQHLIVGMAGMAKHSQQVHANKGHKGGLTAVSCRRMLAVSVVVVVTGVLKACGRWYVLSH
jgi:hypothetical protein